MALLAVTLLLMVPTALAVPPQNPDSGNPAHGSSGSLLGSSAPSDHLPPEPTSLRTLTRDEAVPELLPRSLDQGRPPGTVGDPGVASGLTAALLPASFPSTSGGRSGYPSPPAPMGLADLGEGANGTYSYTPNSFAAIVTLNSTSA